MNTRVKAITAVMHGRIHLQPGEEGQFSKGDAEELQKSGLVTILGDAPAIGGADSELTPYVQADNAPGQMPEQHPDDLRAMGLLEGGKGDNADNADDLDTLLGGEKAEEAPDNKMADAPANKAGKAKATAKKGD